MESESTKTEVRNERWILIRDVLVFQFKLVVDGFRDVALLPVSLIVAIVSLFGKRPPQDSEFYDLLRLARRSERWINLFGVIEKKDPAPPDDEQPAPKDLDALVARVETFLVDEYRKGGVTAQAKQRMDAALNSLHRARKRPDRNQPE